MHHLTGCFFFVGGALPGEARPHHKSVFDFDEVSACANYETSVIYIADKFPDMMCA